MNFQGPMMDSPNSGCGCCPKEAPTMSNCYNVVQTCNVEEVPHYTNYHTHVVNNCIKRHINIPTYSTDSETVIINEYVEGQPLYQQPMYQQPMYQQPTYQQYPNQTQGYPGQVQGTYQGNVASNPNVNMGPGQQGFNPFNF